MFLKEQVEEWMNAADEWTLIAIATTLIVLVLSTLVWCVLRRVMTPTTKTRKGRTLLLLGPNASGKTVLFHRLCFGTNVDTQTSMAESTASVHIVADADSQETSDVDVVDVPGHPRLRRYVPLSVRLVVE